MPEHYTITTKHPLTRRNMARGEDPQTCTTVATLDEARHIAAHEARQRIPVNVRATALLAPAHNLSESGGTIGPLPDGTVIEVRRA